MKDNTQLARSKIVHSGTAKLIKINKAAIHEIVAEYIMGEQGDLFETKELPTQCMELFFWFTNDGDLACVEYDREKGILEIDDCELEKADYTTSSLFSSECCFREITVKNGKIEGVQKNTAC